MICPNRPTTALDSRVIGDEFTGHVHGHKRVSIDVDVDSVIDRLFNAGLAGCLGFRLGASDESKSDIKRKHSADNFCSIRSSFVLF
jgi:hypothetical protein